MNQYEPSPFAAERLEITGLVQGVGFRPFVWHLAQQHHLTGSVLNDGQGVEIIIQGPEHARNNFVEDIQSKTPKLAVIDALARSEFILNKAYDEFTITASNASKVEIAIVADAASCEDCLEDISDPTNRRFRYPFTNCTHCGPRYSIVKQLPYDRPQTTMADFTLCPDCLAEYMNPADRRFHAQPNACPVCGPKIWLETSSEHFHSEVIENTADLIRSGAIVAIKGIGGYQLVCDASNNEVVGELRKRKNRPAKPFALMAKNVAEIKHYCEVNDTEAELLQSQAAPIVLLKAIENNLSPNLAPGHNRLGFVLPYSPLHHLLMQEVAGPIVFTSGNNSGLPQCCDNDQAIEQLSTIADGFLHHNRGISNRVDDSVVKVVNNQPYFYRRSRGYAPQSTRTSHAFASEVPILACGSQMKNTISMLKGQRLITSQYIGDLESVQSIDDFQTQLQRLGKLFDVSPGLIVVDQHPEYQSTKWGKQQAEEQNISVLEVQHHHAHLAACLFDNDHQPDDGKVLGLVMDGLGYGTDHTIWGGELLLADYHDYQRIGRLKPVAMPGATKAIEQPWRMLLSHLLDKNTHLSELPEYLSKQLTAKETTVIKNMVQQGLNSPLTSSCGRLFDAVAAALGICFDEITYEGQAAIELQQMAERANDNNAGYPFDINNSELIELDTGSLWPALMNDLNKHVDVKLISHKFHHGLANAFFDMADQARAKTGVHSIALCGGVFQNDLLLQLTRNQLQASGFKVMAHQQLTPNDACISVGQITIATQHLRSKMLCV